MKTEEFVRCTYVEHVEENVEFDDGLAAYEMVHHRHVDVAHHGAADEQDDALEHVTQLRRVENT